MTRIESITIIGVGLIGTSFALSARKAGFRGKITGCDRAGALSQAQQRGAFDAGDPDPTSAVRDAQLVMLAAPVAANLSLLSQIAPHVPADALITDVGSTKSDIAAAAEKLFGKDSLRRFLPGHPIAGKEVSGAQHADEELFQNAPWVLTPAGGRHALIAPELSRGMHREFMRLVESVGARLVVTTPEKHDRVLAFTSHLPQLISTALAMTVRSEIGATAELRDLSGRGLREMSRLAKSDPELWSAVAASNRKNLESALAAMEGNLAALRKALGTDDFERLFAKGREFDIDAEPADSDGTEPPRFG